MQENVVDLWHKILGHVSFSLLNKLVSKDLVRGLPQLKFAYSKVCDAYVKVKQTRSSFKPKKESKHFQTILASSYGKSQVKEEISIS